MVVDLIHLFMHGCIENFDAIFDVVDFYESKCSNNGFKSVTDFNEQMFAS